MHAPAYVLHGTMLTIDLTSLCSVTLYCRQGRFSSFWANDFTLQQHARVCKVNGHRKSQIQGTQLLFALRSKFICSRQKLQKTACTDLKVVLSYEIDVNATHSLSVCPAQYP